MEVSFRLCHGLAGKACGGQWSCTDRLYTDWVTESDNLSNITLICNLSRNTVKREMTTRISSSPLLGNVVQSPTSVPTK